MKSILSCQTSRKNFAFLLVLVLESVLSIVLYLCGIFLPRNILGELIAHDLNTAFIWVLIMVLSETIGQLILSYIGLNKRLMQRSLNCVLNDKLIKSSFLCSYQSYENYEFRENFHLAQKCITDSHISGAITSIFSIGTNAITILPLLWIVSSVTWWLWLVLVGSVIINGVCEWIRNKYVRSLFSETNQDDYHMLYARDVLPSKKFAKEIRLFHLYNYVSQSLKRYIHDLASLQNKQASKTFRLYMISYGYSFIQTVVILIYVLFQCTSGLLPIPDFMMACLSIIGISELSVSLIKSVIQVREDFFYISHYCKMVEIDPKQCIDQNLLEMNKANALCFQNVSFTYNGATKPAIDNLSVELTCGKTYGIVGKNGSGKSTFVNLLMKLYTPDKGKISFGKVDLNEISFAAWQAQVSAVLQDFHIYSFTVQDNITFGQNENVDDLLHMLDIPYEANQPIRSDFEEGGIELSGGEEQKLAMVRAIYKNAEFYIFDEPTSSLSATGEKRLYDVVKKQFIGKTVFFISHRLASCTMCDDILLFDEGKIVERGTHQELMAHKGQYYKMFRAQADQYKIDEMKEL